VWLIFDQRGLVPHEWSSPLPGIMGSRPGNDYLLNLTTIAPMRSPFLKSFLGLLGCAL
jgi:hypothetical protein